MSQALEIEVQLAEKQFTDLCLHRNNLYLEAERLDTVKRKQLQERIAYYKDAQHEVQVKKKQVQREIKHMKGAFVFLFLMLFAICFDDETIERK